MISERARAAFQQLDFPALLRAHTEDMGPICQPGAGHINRVTIDKAVTSRWPIPDDSFRFAACFGFPHLVLSEADRLTRVVGFQPPPKGP